MTPEGLMSWVHEDVYSVAALVTMLLANADARQPTDLVSQDVAPAAVTRPADTPSVARQIESKPGLSARIAPLLPATGLSLADAAAGFTNEGIFIVALHVSHNERGIPFAALRREMIDHRLSLDHAIERLNRSIDVTAAVVLAQRQAEVDMLADSSPAGGSQASERHTARGKSRTR
jgi:hypothetical protein